MAPRQYLFPLALLIAASALSATACNDSNDTTEPGPSPTTAITASPFALATAVISPIPAPPIPDKYKQAYSDLESALTKFETTLPSGNPKVTDIGAVSTSLVLANSNSGTAILRPAVMDAIKSYLDQMVKIGSSAVEVQISYPVGSKDFPDQGAYIAFYKQVIAQAHQRGIKVLIETSCIFSNSPFTDIQFDFSKLTSAAYFQARTDEIVTIAKEIRPDFLSFGEEPVNEKVFAGINYTADQYVAYVNATATAVRSALGTSTPAVKLGVGTGTWEEDLFKRFVNETDLDFYDIHIYPLQGNPPGLDVARQMAQQVQAKGRSPIIGETWLYKLPQSEAGQPSGATAAEAFRRDAFTFWEPLEARYMRDILALGAEFKMPLVSFWGARFWFGQVDWTPQLDALDFRGISQVVNPIITKSLSTGERTVLGNDFAKLMGKN